MKKLGVLMVCMALSLFLFAGSASAVDVKFSGNFNVMGLYEAQPFTGADWTYMNPVTGLPELHQDKSTAFIFQELKLKTVFEVSPGLSLTMRFQALTKAWVDRDWAGTRGDSLGRFQDGNGLARENIEIQDLYMSYAAGKVGTFHVGYVPHDTAFGPVFGASERPLALIQWGKPVGDFSFGFKYMKSFEGSTTWKNTLATGRHNQWASLATDGDRIHLAATAVYKKDPVFTGLKWAYTDNRANRPFTNVLAPGVIPIPPGSPATQGEWSMQTHMFTYFAVLNFGPVKIEGKTEYLFGKQDFEDGRKDARVNGLSAYLNAEVAPGPFTFGGTYAYVSGNDPATRRMEHPGTGATNGAYSTWGGQDYNPALIMWNEDRNEWRGPLGNPALGDNRVYSGVINAHMVSVYGNYRPTADWDLKLTYLFARAAERPMETNVGRYVSKTYGHELDFVATYKITNNLKYSVGAGYLWAGDYFKGGDDTRDIDDDYLFMNKLSLTF